MSLGLVVADYLWLRHQAKLRHEKRYHRSGEGDAPVSAGPLAGQSKATSHE